MREIRIDVGVGDVVDFVVMGNWFWSSHVDQSGRSGIAMFVFRVALAFGMMPI